MAENYYTGTVWEKQVAYCRAKKVGNLIFVAGTTAVNENGEIVGTNVYEQTVFVFKKIQKALQHFGADLPQVVRTRIYLLDISQFSQVAQAHKEFFEGIDPVSTCIEVSKFVSPNLLVEIEVDAVI
jgi:enamine deaminase RidA (YjgF/YER057c/UK114 family)